MADHELDRVAMQRDAALVHALATRTLPPDDVDLDDPIVTHLAVWADWVDAGANDAVTPFELAPGKDRVVALSRQRARRRPNRAVIVAGGAVVALVVSSGAAAAVTGDPFLVAKAPLEVLKKVNPFDSGGDAAQNAREELPDRASDVAEANKLLADAQRAIAHGNFEKAQRLVDEAKGKLGGRPEATQQHRIDHLTEVIAGHDHQVDQTDKTTEGQGNGDTGNEHGQPSDPGSGSGDHTDKTDHNDKAGDNGNKGGGDDPGKTTGTGQPDPPDTTDDDGTQGQGDHIPKGQSSGKGKKPDEGGSGGSTDKGQQAATDDAAQDR
jgi:hypothetical protein